MKKPIRSFLTFSLTWVGLALLTLLYSGFTFVPNTIIGWLLFLVVAPVVFVALHVVFELLGAGVQSLPPVRAVSGWIGRRTADEEFSVERIFWGVLGFLLFVSFFLACLWSVRLLTDWIAR